MKYRSILGVSLAGVMALSSVAVSAANTQNEYTDQLIIQFDNPNESGVSRAYGLSQQINKSLEFVRTTSLGAHVYKLPSKESLPQVKGYATALKAVFGVQDAEADQMMFPIGDLQVPPTEGTTTNSVPIYSYQWHYHESTGGMNAETAWGFMNSTDPSVNVAVLDTGILPHPDFSSSGFTSYVGGTDMIHTSFVGNDGDGRDADPSDPGDWTTFGECYGGSPASDSSWHGTHVSGTISAVTNNAQGVAGVGYNLLNVVPVRVLGKCGGYTSDIADGIVWAATGLNNPNKAKVINMSLGGSGSCSSTYQNAINTAVAAGTTVVVAAGNSNANAANYSPASCDNVISVASTGRTGDRAYYSNYGSVVDLAAPGGDMSSSGYDGVLSTLNNGDTTPNASGYNYAFYQGTSMAAPHVAAVAALLYSKSPTITPAQVEVVLRDTARAFPGTCDQCGSGILDAGAAIASVTGEPLPDVPTAPLAPSDFAAAAGTGVANLSWIDESDNETGFYIEKSKKNRRKWGGFSEVDTTAVNATTYQVTGLDGTYRFRIRSQNSVGTSEWILSNEVVVSSGDSSDDGGSTCKGGWKKCGSN